MTSLSRYPVETATSQNGDSETATHRLIWNSQTQNGNSKPKTVINNNTIQYNIRLLGLDRTQANNTGTRYA